MQIRVINTKERERGYYWCRVKRTKLWIIAKWSPSVSCWSTCEPLENDTRGGFDRINPKRLEYVPESENKIAHKRTRRERIKPVKIKRRRIK
jgi:hypothetical protein